MKVDTWPVSVNIAMPVGLVVNELMTNALKHAFKDREVVKLSCATSWMMQACQISVANNGIGLSNPSDWR